MRSIWSLTSFLNILVILHKFHRVIRRKCDHTTIGENYAVMTTSSRRKWPNTSGQVTCEIFNWFRCWEPAAAFPIDRRECDRLTKFPGHPVGSLAVRRRRSKGNRHAVIGESRSFRVLSDGFVLKHGCVAICPTLQLGHWSCGQFEHLQMEICQKCYSFIYITKHLFPNAKKSSSLSHLANSKSYFKKYWK